MVGFVESFFEHREYFNSSLLDFFKNAYIFCIEVYQLQLKA